MRASSAARVLAYFLFVGEGLASLSMTSEQIREARHSLSGMLQDQSADSKSKLIPYGLSSWYTGIPTPEGLTVHPQVEGFLGLREHYRISSSGLYAAFDAVPSGPAGGSKLVLGMYELRCPAKDKDGKILDGTARMIAAEDPITHFKLAFPLWQGEEGVDDYQIEVEPPSPSATMRRRFPGNRLEELLKRALKKLYYGSAGAAYTRHKNSSPLGTQPGSQSNVEASEVDHNVTANLWLLRELCEDATIYNQGQDVAVADSKGTQ
ncbi:hypothetical protein FOZ61_009430 [Perkinsus olseni]|uniref:Uncharacterized protein n=1 Tax=Perkinsus olseni TaxID=32597 RepID=A0A7J6KZX0_PEROL|nr:hypothetical protein FOZ61_009430 [Perkinsus olseni]KAF4654776.1 hypothetical protein FOL46_008548 [Perkinsus olseni]